MHTRRGLLAGIVAAALAGCGGDDAEGAAGTTVSPSPTTASQVGSLSIASSAFADGEAIPARFTADGTNVSPPLSIESVPSSAGSLALVVDDPDAPTPPFTHWLCWGLPPDVGEIPEGIPQTERVESIGGAVQGHNDFEELGYSGPAPPSGDDPHRYRFTVHALESELGLQPGAGRGAVDEAMAGSVLATARLVGTYGR